MEKEFGTYEYLVKYNGSVENDNSGQQIIIVQENGHLININKPTEYLAQDEDTKEFQNETCPIYNVSSQPIYYQHISSSEPIPVVETSNVFENTYLLPNAHDEQIGPENDIYNKLNDVPFACNLKEESDSMDIDDTNKLNGGYAEITLSDEQYEILKEKGWILLEIKDKFFLLDSSGLHEITSDEELVTKLKLETNQDLDKNSQVMGCSLKVVINSENVNDNAGCIPKQEDCDQTEPMETPSGLETVQQVNVADRVTQNSMIIAVPEIPLKAQLKNEALSDNNKDTIGAKKKPRKICLKTRYLLKDIPKEIVLGKTVNGKNLIARVIKGKGFLKNSGITNRNNKYEVGKDRYINDKQFAKLVQQVLLGTAENSRMEDIASAETVMSQMFQVPNLKLNLHKHKLIVTKTIREENEDGLIVKQSEPTVVTGKFIINENNGAFIHIPDMLQQHMKSTEPEKNGQIHDNDSEKTETPFSEDDMFLHVNITETKDIKNISRVSVIINKRNLSLSQIYNMKTKYVNAFFACTTCAKVFKSQEELENHQEIKFDNVKDSQEHLKLHPKEAAIVAKYLKSSEHKQETDMFKCKMCDNSYIHSSSLTKHILAKHIKQKK